jgi:hypothetical protein
MHGGKIDSHQLRKNNEKANAQRRRKGKNRNGTRTCQVDEQTGSSPIELSTRVYFLSSSDEAAGKRAQIHRRTASVLWSLPAGLPASIQRYGAPGCTHPRQVGHTACGHVVSSGRRLAAAWSPSGCAVRRLVGPLRHNVPTRWGNATSRGPQRADDGALVWEHQIWTWRRRRRGGYQL